MSTTPFDARNARPFPIPVVAFGPGSQPEDETLDYITMPTGMDTFAPPRLPEPEDLQGHGGALGALRATLAALAEAAAGGRPAPIALQGLDDTDRALVHQVLGEGEVAAQVRGADDSAAPRLQAQESVFAGVWRVVGQTDDGRWLDQIEVAPVPAAIVAAAQADSAQPQAEAHAAPEGVVNATPVLAELADHRAAWAPGRATEVVNLTLLPMSPTDIAWMDHVLGTGRVLLLSRGYGNCRITNARVPHTWRVVFYNSQDAVILNTVEVGPLPAVACAAPEDLQDSHERFAEVLQWVAQA